MKKIAPAILLAIALLPLSLQAQSQPPGCAVGNVFEDRNGNGVRDAGEPGLADIAVSNGRDIVRTDARGDYRLPPREGAEIFVIKPAGHRAASRADGLPDVWRSDAWQADPAMPAATCAPIALRKEAFPPLREQGLRVLLFGDPQPKSLVDVGHYERAIIEPLIAENANPVHGMHLHRAPQVADLGLSMGDITHDDPSLYPALNRATAKLGVPWLHAPGNHDIDLAAGDDATSLKSFRSVYGPDTFAWEEPEAAFIVLDDVIWQPAARPNYIGGFREDQFAFLRNYLRDAPKQRLLVLALHIPLYETAGSDASRDTFRDEDRARLFALLRDFPNVLVLSAHMHAQQHFFHDDASGWHGAQPLHEYNLGATCGAFWSGVTDANGVPDSTMSDGTPKGWARMSVRADGHYSLSYHPAQDPHQAMHLHAPTVLRRGAYPAWGVYANVYMGMADSRVEYRVDGGEWKPMRKVSQPDPRLLAENRRDDEAVQLRGYDRSPEAQPSPHLWRGALPTDLAVGEHVIEVRALDRWQGEQRATTRYRLEDASP